MKNLNIEAKVDNLPQVLMFIDSYLEEADCPMKAQMQIDISVEEIFVNIAQYAYPGRIGHADIQISGSSADGRFIIVFRDRGIPYDPLRKSDPDITLGAEDRPIGGLGILMVKKNMDKLEYSRSGGENIFTMTKNA